jgi:outer membrane protein TolC
MIDAAGRNRRWRCRAAAWSWLAVAAQLSAATLPDPLTLEDALLLAGDNHPSLALSRATLAEAEAGASRTAARDDLDIGARLEARLIDPSDVADDQSNNDSQATLYAKKRLYDFGHSAALEAAAATSVTGSRLQLAADLSRYRLQIMKAFFDVLLADLEYARDNEAMAVAYVQADRTGDRNELGQVSDIELLKQQDTYQSYRMRRLRSEARLRTTRARLAQLLDRPEDLPANLARPQLPENDQPLPEYEQLVDAALARNPRVLALKADLEAARLRVKAERAGGRPVLSGSLSASTYHRELSGYNPLEAELRLDIPLYEGDRVKAEVAQAQAEMQRLGARLRQLEYDLRQDLLEVWLDIQALLAQREQVKIFSASRDRNFDQAQAEYELQLKTDFGDALVGQSESALLGARTEFQLAIDWARLGALTGEPYSPYLQTTLPPQPGNEPHEDNPR